MIIEYDTQKLNQAVKDFYNATGINLMLLKKDFSMYEGLEKFNTNPYCKALQSPDFGERMCKNSDFFLLEKCKKTGKSEMHICHAGLIDVAVPLIYDNSIIGYIILGQMRQNDDFASVEERLSSLNLDLDKMREYFFRLPLFDEKKIKSIENLAVILAKYILFEKIIKPNTDADLTRIIEYIEQNLESDLSIKSIAKNTNFSKSVMYKIFHDKFNCTVGRYISLKRIEKAEELLKCTNLPIDIIASSTGFSSTAYFSKTFKSIKGVTPSKYRK